MKYRVGQIWHRKTTNNYFAIIKKEGSEVNLCCISGDTLGNHFGRNIIDLKQRYTRVIDCITCKTSRIRHTSPFKLAHDGCCWSCI